MKNNFSKLIVVIFVVILGQNYAFAVEGFQNLKFGTDFRKLTAPLGEGGKCGPSQIQWATPTVLYCVPGYEVLGLRRPTLLYLKDQKLVMVSLVLGPYTKAGFSVFDKALASKYKVSKKPSAQILKRFNSRVINEIGIEYDGGTVYLKVLREKIRVVKMFLIYRDKAVIEKPKKKGSGL